MGDEAKRFEQDATGAIGNAPMRATENPIATPAGDPDDAKETNPEKPAHTVEDPGWKAEEPGSAFAHEREGVPQGDGAEQVPDSATRTRRSS